MIDKYPEIDFWREIGAVLKILLQDLMGKKLGVNKR